MQRREGLGDEAIRSRSITQRSLRSVSIIGTRVGGAAPAAGGIAGTVNFGLSFEAGSGKRAVLITIMAGSRSFGRAQPMRVPNIGTAHFTYRASGSGGTFWWMAMGSVAPPSYS